MNELRANGIAAELFHEQAKFDKQFKFAEKKNIPYIIILGEKELMENTLNIKELKTGVQQTIATSDILKFFKN
jgi:histidyl-tRNA synthetase